MGRCVSRHRPSVNVLGGAIRWAGFMWKIGMGDDVTTVCSRCTTQGAATIAEDEETCAVFGMPKEAIARGGRCGADRKGRVDALPRVRRLPATRR